MERKYVPEEVLKFEKLFHDAISAGDYDDDNYKNISQIVNFMKSHTENLQEFSWEEVIFLTGPSGAGKSTLMNYLSKEGNLLVDEYGKIFAGESIAEIGDGKTSTTLFPNIWKHDDIKGTFIDCAGDFDSRGVLTEAINSKIKMLLANSVRSAKMLLVIPQPSLGAEGAYGKMFKEALDKNATFFNDINYFRDNILLVISHAGRNPKTSETIDTLLNTAMEKSLSNYSDTVKHVMEQKNVVTFCKPSEEASSGSSYEPPAWNADERKLILNKITELNFIAIPQKDFFNISSSLEVKEQMGKALDLVKKAAVQFLRNSIKEAITPKLKLYATELKPFADFLKHLQTKKISAGLAQYVKYMNYNNFLGISPDPETIDQLTDELKYLEAFACDPENSSRGKGNNYDWNNLTGIPSLLQTIYDEVAVIINKSSELFTEFGSYNHLIVKGGFLDSENLKQKLKELGDKHAEKRNVESLRHNTNSEYYCDVREQVLDRMERDTYTRTEYYSESEPYTKTETYTVDVPYTETEYYQEEEDAPVRSMAVHILTLGLGTVGKGLFTGNPFYSDTVTRSREVTRYRKELKERQVTDYRTVAKTREVEDYRDRPIYKYVNRRKFNESAYNRAIKKIDDDTTGLRKHIMEILTRMKSVNQSMEATLTEDVLNKVKENIAKCLGHIRVMTTQSTDLFEQWKFLEHQSLFLKKTDFSLDISNMEKVLEEDIPEGM